LNRLSATELATQLQRRELSALDVIEHCLARIQAREHDIHAWESIDPDYARNQARDLDAGPVLGPLHGLPIGVKDIIDTVDLPTQHGSPIYTGHRPACDAACVASVRAAGGVVLGKTVTTEFATFSPAATVNPRDFAHTPGGSSSGSVAAVADDMVPLAFGTQTVGSIIRPASFCGVVGYKPSFGTVSRSGVKLLAESLDTVGAIARTVPDAALFIGALTARSELMALPRVDDPLRIGVCLTHDWHEVEPEVVTVMDTAWRELAAAGARMSQVELPEGFRALDQAQRDILGYEIVRNLGYENRKHRGRLSSALREMLDTGGQVTAERYDEAQQLTRDCRLLVSDVFDECDVLLAPSTTGEAPEGLKSTGDPVMNRLWTLLHLPCVNVPVARGPNGLPVGLQVVGRFADDARTLAAATWIHDQFIT